MSANCHFFMPKAEVQIIFTSTKANQPLLWMPIHTNCLIFCILKPLSRLCGDACWFVSELVGNYEDIFLMTRLSLVGVHAFGLCPNVGAGELFILKIMKCHLQM